MKFINLTRNTLSIHTKNGVVQIKPEQVSAFTRVSQKAVREVGGIEIVETLYGPVLLPDEKEGVGLVVSKLAADAIMFQSQGERNDVYIPSGQIKDESGRIIGCRGLEHIY